MNDLLEDLIINIRNKDLEQIIDLAERNDKVLKRLSKLYDNYSELKIAYKKGLTSHLDKHYADKYSSDYTKIIEAMNKGMLTAYDKQLACMKKK